MRAIKLTFAIIILLFIALSALRYDQYRKYSSDLQEQGYSKDWANHKAKVELKIIAPDELYYEIEND